MSVLSHDVLADTSLNYKYAQEIYGLFSRCVHVKNITKFLTVITIYSFLAFLTSIVRSWSTGGFFQTDAFYSRLSGLQHF